MGVVGIIVVRLDFIFDYFVYLLYQAAGLFFSSLATQRRKEPKEENCRLSLRSYSESPLC